jgi:hypothetical protein
VHGLWRVCWVCVWHRRRDLGCCIVEGVWGPGDGQPTVWGLLAGVRRRLPLSGLGMHGGVLAHHPAPSHPPMLHMACY